MIFTSDNGLANREHRALGKQIPYDISVRVPMIVRYPSVPAGTFSNALVSNVDLAPTIADFAGVSIDAEGLDATAVGRRSVVGPDLGAAREPSVGDDGPHVLRRPDAVVHVRPLRHR